MRQSFRGGAIIGGGGDIISVVQAEFLHAAPHFLGSLARDGDHREESAGVVV
jgi:hypothetical protein